MGHRMVTAALVSALGFGGSLSGVPGQQPPSVDLQVYRAEQAFARTMADRDVGEFATFIADEAIFFGPSVLRGKPRILEAWGPFFEGDEAPFSWAPEDVEVLPSGGLAHSSGPIFNAAGERIGTFNTVWRLESDGRWRVVFDRGCSCIEGG